VVSQALPFPLFIRRQRVLRLFRDTIRAAKAVATEEVPMTFSFTNIAIVLSLLSGERRDYTRSTCGFQNQ
jgi:hypothetical protein